MKVSVIVVTLNEEKNIRACLDSLLSQDIPKEDFEVLVVDGGSKDTTEEIVEEYRKHHKNLYFFVKEKGSITVCRNVGIHNAQYDYIAFTDADCIVPADWLRRLKRGFSRHAVANEKLAGVGGANIPPENGNVFQKAVGICFNSLLGSLGSVQAMPVRQNKKVFSISCSNSLYKKSALMDVRGFSEELGNQGEDWDLGAKLQNKGYKVYAIHDCFVWHNFRATPVAFWKNMMFYGDGRMLLMTKHVDKIKVKYVLPLLFIPIIFLSLISFVVTKKWPLLLPLLYFPFMLLYSFIISLRCKKTQLVMHVFLVFLLQHFGYSFGELKGLRWFLA